MKEGLDKDISKKENSLTKENRDHTVENGKKKSREGKPATKVVVRRLPPTMTLDLFMDQVSPLPPVDYMYFVQADMSLTPHSYSRAYIHFSNQEDLFIFTEKFDNYVFVDSKGQEYTAVVEFAPFQRIPKHRPNRKKDPKMGTIESDPAFIGFKNKLETEKLENKLAISAVKQHFFETPAETTEEKEVGTPLLDYIRLRRAERQRFREEKREEKRKKDLERRRAKDEYKKTKKDEDSSALKPKDQKSNIPVEDSNLPNDNLDISNLLSDSKNPVSSDPNLPKDTPVSVSSLQKCLLEFQKNILMTDRLNKNNKKKMGPCNENNDKLINSNGSRYDEDELELLYRMSLNSNKDTLQSPLFEENVAQKAKDFEGKTNEISNYCVGSGDSLIKTNTNSQQQLMPVSVLKNPLINVTQVQKNGFNKNMNHLQDDQIQIIKPLHRFAQKSIENVSLLSKVEKEKICTKGFCNNLSKIVEDVIRKNSLDYNLDMKNTNRLNNVNIGFANAMMKGEGKNRFNGTECQNLSKVVHLQSPRPMKNLNSKSLTSFTLNESYSGDNSSVVSSSKSDRSLDDNCDELVPPIFKSPLEKTFEHENKVTKVWHHGTRTFPRRPHNHTNKTYFPVSKKAKA